MLEAAASLQHVDVWVMRLACTVQCSKYEVGMQVLCRAELC